MSTLPEVFLVEVPSGMPISNGPIDDEYEWYVDDICPDCGNDLVYSPPHKSSCYSGRFETEQFFDIWFCEDCEKVWVDREDALDTSRHEILRKKNARTVDPGA